MDDQRDERPGAPDLGETAAGPARIFTSPDDENPDVPVDDEAHPDEARTDDPEDDETKADAALEDAPDAAALHEATVEQEPADEPSDDEPVVDRTPDDASDDDVPPGETQVDAVAEDAPRDDVPSDDERSDDAPSDDVRSDGVPSDDEPVPAAAEPVAAAAPNGWRVLGRALRPRSTKAQVLAGLLCALLGFALVVQVRQNNGTNLEGMRQADLVRMLDETTDRSDALQRQASDLQAEHDQLVSGSDRRQAALDALERTATTQGILTGRLPAQGPGIVLTLSEPSGSIRPLTMLDVLEEMRNAGAEAVELNGHRVTASSAFTGQPGAVVLDGATLKAPYRWTAIGDPDTIATALQIPGGALAAVRNDGGQGTVERNDLVKVTAIRAVPDPVYATPAPAATP